MRKFTIHQRLASGLCLAVLAAACDSGTGPAGSPTNLSVSETSDISAAFEDDTDVSLGALIYGGTLNNADLSVGTLSAPAMNGAPPRPGLECLVIEPMPPEDPDLDGVPTLLSVHFDPEPCVVPTDRGISFIFTGVLGVADPTPQTAAYDLDETYDRFGHGVAITGGRSFLVVRTGERHVRQQGNNIGAAEAFASVHVVNERLQRHAVIDWALRFSGEETIVFGRPFPSGSLSIEGTWAFSHEDADRLFRVETAVPLHYDATCIDARPVRRITEGVIHKLLVVNGERVGVLVITWVGCGRPPVREWHRFDESDRPTDRPTDGGGSDTA